LCQVLLRLTERAACLHRFSCNVLAITEAPSFVFYRRGTNFQRVVQYGNMRGREYDEEVEEQPTSMYCKTFPFFCLTV